MMRVTVYVSPLARAALSDEHAASSYGLPVLVAGEDVYGRADRLPSGMLAGTLVQKWLDGDDAGSGGWGPLSAEALKAARLFLGVA